MEDTPTHPRSRLGCSDAAPLMADYIQQELAEDERRGLEAHLRSCPACQARVAFERRLAEKLRALGKGTVPVRLARRVRRVIAAGEDLG
jgi:anti-sigma factor RsiW